MVADRDSYPEGGVSLLWFNPPYDRIRGAGRTELTLFNKVREWPARLTGLLLMIVPDKVLADTEVGLATAVERDFELLGLWRYPEPEYSEFNQCVLLARRRGKALDKTRLLFPRWAVNPSGWRVLPDKPKPIADGAPRGDGGFSANRTTAVTAEAWTSGARVGWRAVRRHH